MLEIFYMDTDRSILDILYEDVFNNSPFGIYTLDAEGVITSFNSKMAELSGDRPEKAIGLNALELDSYKSVGLNKLFIKGINGEAFETELEYSSYLANKKSVRHYRGIPIQDHGVPKQARLLLIVEDITQRKMMEKALKNEEARLRASINSLSVGYIMTGPNNEFLLINQSAESIMTLDTPSAYPARQAIDVSDLRGKINLEYIQNALRDSFDLIEQLEKSRREKMGILLKDINYKLLHLNIHITPIINTGSQEALGSVILLEDITEQKLLERSRDEFFSIASHELRTPLTAIRGNASLIQTYHSDEITNPEIKSIINDIHNASVRLIDIVNDFLDMSRLEQGKLQYEKEVFDIAELAESVVKEYDVTGSRKKLNLSVNNSGVSLPLVYTDKARVREILSNLLGNSIKFTTEGGVNMTFEKLNNLIKVYVQDTGSGISEEQVPLLFRKFQQAQSDILTRDRSQGTGLGLYISQMMARGMGGDVVLENSEVGIGSTFSVTIPVATDQQIKNKITPQDQGNAPNAV